MKQNPHFFKQPSLHLHAKGPHQLYKLARVSSFATTTRSLQDDAGVVLRVDRKLCHMLHTIEPAPTDPFLDFQAPHTATTRKARMVPR